MRKKCLWIIKPSFFTTISPQHWWRYMTRRASLFFFFQHVVQIMFSKSRKARPMSMQFQETSTKNTELQQRCWFLNWWNWYVVSECKHQPDRHNNKYPKNIKSHQMCESLMKMMTKQWWRWEKGQEMTHSKTNENKKKRCRKEKRGVERNG